MLHVRPAWIGLETAAPGEMHLGHLAQSGAALLTIEATAVTAEGRISARDLGLWNDDTERALGQTLESVRRWSDMPIAIQLAHAGRKASVKEMENLMVIVKATISDMQEQERMFRR